MNFSLCRMLLTSILMLVVSYTTTVVPGSVPGGTHTPGYEGPFPPTLVPLKRTRVVKFVDQWPEDDNFRDLLSITTYHSYVVEKVLTAGETARFARLDTDALAYAYPPITPNKGVNSGDRSADAGAIGWLFSTSDLLQFMGDFRRGGLILSNSEAQNMLKASFGIDLIDDRGAGTFYRKDGYWDNYPHNETEQSVVYFLPGQTELVVLVNSTIAVSTNDTWLRGIVEPTYAAHLVQVF
jgi:hypothetical protein